ncbi:DUF1223 domain-containing protein [Qingshengfaniella alkalisoli]|uniref:DUF1223 domain-containing protein n=1 Tax=Qingshengfaniella alkalisoli TaxID=2599296 RepID=A0A5B8I8C6_9RHOB|nr:DUF1223 domain-containing protein [Qingshengfaniella alkalisoli]QDY68906.1 DUF1223 domain-containing protein [Qingshengfaniella alkalisoli]
MKRYAIGAIFAAATVLGVCRAAADPIVVELFTSQGCSSCPPADELLSELADADGIIALALHVDYWDYIGWKDIFGSQAFTKRQKSYAHANGKNSIYTPQMILDGVTDVVGNDPLKVMMALEKHESRPVRARMKVERDGAMVTIRLEPVGEIKTPADVQIVSYLPSATVEITRGENAGRTITYRNIVTGWSTVGTWSGDDDQEIEARLMSSEDPVVVLVQEENQGEILAAEALR